MKQSLLAVVLIAGLSACGTKTTPEAQATTATVTIDVPTVQCSTCRQTITTALTKIDGVDSVMVDIDKKKATVIFASGKLDRSSIEDAIVNAGYDADGKKANPEAYKNLPECCKLPADQHGTMDSM